jgi:hypothetical protein
MVVEVPKYCERTGCRRAPITFVSGAVRPDRTKGMWLCRKHEMREIRAQKGIVIKDEYDD